MKLVTRNFPRHNIYHNIEATECGHRKVKLPPNNLWSENKNENDLRRRTLTAKDVEVLCRFWYSRSDRSTALIVIIVIFHL